MSETHMLYCTVCKVNFFSKKHWNQHLLAPGHQDRARKELAQWDEEIRKCAIVLYSSFSLVFSGADGVLQYFSEGKNAMTFVTDFVLSKSSPKTAIVQFESSMKLAEIFSESGGPLIKIDEQVVQLRKLGELLELEWTLLFESFQASLRGCPLGLQLRRLSSSKALQVAQEKNRSQNQLEKSGAAADENERIGSKNVQHVYNQFQSSLQKVEIPDEEFNLVLEAIQEVKGLLEDTVSKKCIIVSGKCDVGKIFDPSSKMRIPLGDYILMAIKKGAHQSIPSGQIGSSLFKDGGLCWSKTRRLFFHQQLGIDFQLMHGSSHVLELQLSRLLTYYCEFDTRIKPLLRLAYYWANLNTISYAKKRGDSKPAAFEWLLLFFLYNKKKIIPVPKVILERLHTPVYVNKEDVGFNSDMDFANSWRLQVENSNSVNELSTDCDAFVLSLLEIFHEFLVFCVEELSDFAVLDTRNGELLTMDTCLEREKNKLVVEDLKTDIKCKIRPCLVITNPLNRRVADRLPLYRKKWSKMIYPAMKKTSSKLFKFINLLKEWMPYPHRIQQLFLVSLKNALRAI